MLCASSVKRLGDGVLSCRTSGTSGEPFQLAQPTEWRGELRYSDLPMQAEVARSSVPRYVPLRLR